MVRAILLLAVVIPSAGNAPRSQTPRPPTPCPSPPHDTAIPVRIFLNSPLLPEARARFDLGTATPDDIRLLSEPMDHGTCETLWSLIDPADIEPGDRVEFYRSGDTYFVPVLKSRRPSTPGIVQLDGYSFMLIFTPDFRLVGRFMA